MSENHENQVPAEVALGDVHLRAAQIKGRLIDDRATEAQIAQAHYLRHIATCLETVAGLSLHGHEEHGDHAAQKKAEAEAKAAKKNPPPKPLRIAVTADGTRGMNRGADPRPRRGVK